MSNVIEPYRMNVYQADATKASDYPKLHPYLPVYPVLAIAGESGELMGAIARYQATGDRDRTAEDAFFKDIIKESGDVLWYIAATMRDLGGCITGADAKTFSDLNCYPYVDDTIKMSGDLVLHYSESVGLLCEQVKKGLRDDAEYNIERITAIAKATDRVLGQLAALANSLDFSLDEAAYVNIAKIRDRAARGVSKGSGDNR